MHVHCSDSSVLWPIYSTVLVCYSSLRLHRLSVGIWVHMILPHDEYSNVYIIDYYHFIGYQLTCPPVMVALGVRPCINQGGENHVKEASSGETYVNQTI